MAMDAEINTFQIFMDLKGKKYRTDVIDQDDELLLSADVFFNGNIGHTMYLFEYLVNEEEQEAERLMLGWQLSDQTTLWLGRGHNVVGIWNDAFHHGSYLQTSISRPKIMEFEDDGGFLPTHLTGIFINHDILLGDAMLTLDWVTGYAPHLSDEGNEALNLLDPAFEEHDLAHTFRINYQPTAFDNNQFGIFAGSLKIASEVDWLVSADESFVGSYIDWTVNDWHWISTAFYLHYDAELLTENISDDFYSVYVHTEKPFNQGLTFFARYEQNFSVTSQVKALFDSVVDNALSAGIRYDIAPKNALTLEIRVEDREHINDDKVMLQWSAALF